jgi:transcription antitermination factor NusG
MNGPQGELVWHALRTKPQREEMVANALQRFGIYAQVKTETRLRRKTKWDKERKLQTFVAAPGYCLIGTKPDQPVPWYTIFRLHMVNSVVSYDGRPAQLNHRAVVAFLGHQGGRLPGYFRHFRTGHEFKIGDDILVTRGVLMDHRLKVQDVQEGEAVFMMRLLGRDQEIRIPVDDCIKAEAA